VLNTFAYTCGFTVAAASGGAAETVSVDISPKSLDWGRRNLATNGLPLEPHQFVRSDVFEYYRRAGRRGRHFDLIVLDPPTFSRARRTRRVFSIIADLEPLVAGALSLLEANGLVLLCTNRRETTHEQLLRCIAGPVAAARRRYELVAFSELPEDFRGDPDYAKSVLVRVR
jgi:23S rRNA (cytosine1962-C5)-methyltransferase